MTRTHGAVIRIWAGGLMLASILVIAIGAVPAGAARPKPLPTTYTSLLRSNGQTVVSAHPESFIMTYPSKTKGGVVAVTYWQTQPNTSVIAEMQRAATAKQTFARLVIKVQTGKACRKWSYSPVTATSTKKRKIGKRPVVEVTYTYKKMKVAYTC